VSNELITAYRIELERLREAIDWLVRATLAPHCPWMNLGRMHERIGPGAKPSAAGE